MTFNIVQGCLFGLLCDLFLEMGGKSIKYQSVTSFQCYKEVVPE